MLLAAKLEYVSASKIKSQINKSNSPKNVRLIKIIDPCGWKYHDPSLRNVIG
jgi:hypothetical protein